VPPNDAFCAIVVSRITVFAQMTIVSIDTVVMIGSIEVMGAWQPGHESGSIARASINHRVATEAVSLPDLLVERAARSMGKPLRVHQSG